MIQPAALAASAYPGEYLSFRLRQEEYGIPILTVQEIRGYHEPTRMANAPSFMMGVVNLRGLIVPIVDLRLKFNQPAVYNEVTATIVLNIGRQVMGVVVDSVSDVVALQASDIKPPPKLSLGADASCVTAIATTTQAQGERMLILLDLERLLASDHVGALEPVADWATA